MSDLRNLLLGHLTAESAMSGAEAVAAVDRYVDALREGHAALVRSFIPRDAAIEADAAVAHALTLAAAAVERGRR